MSSWIKSSFCHSDACIEATFIKSSFCADRTCVEATFIKSSHSATNATCVEAASCCGQVVVRDSKNPDGQVLSIDHDQWLAFLDGIRAGDFAEL